MESLFKSAFLNSYSDYSDGLQKINFVFSKKNSPEWVFSLDIENGLQIKPNNFFFNKHILTQKKQKKIFQFSTDQLFNVFIENCENTNFISCTEKVSAAYPPLRGVRSFATSF